MSGKRTRRLRSDGARILECELGTLTWPAHISETDIEPLILCLQSLSLETQLPSHDGSHDWIFRMSPDCPERDVWP